MNVKVLSFLESLITNKPSASILCYCNGIFESFEEVLSLINKNKGQMDHVFILNENKDNKLSIKIFRELKQKLTLKTPNSKQFCIIKNIEEVSIPCLNAFLKILEEPNENVYFILTTSNISKVLPTIQSRSYLLFMENQNSMQKELDNEIFELIRDPKQSYFQQEKHLEIDKIKVLNTILAFEKLLEEKLAYGDLDYNRYATLIKHLNQLKLYTNANVNLKSVLLSLVLQFSDNQVRL
ncbi:hypothetical protein CL656_01450 [bacterium]|nr:hypothetical protein [bacterium]|tara:strand:- start:708 stop:1421 length:714 start_codon:yes stop_codon:yes gene_type:complete